MLEARSREEALVLRPLTLIPRLAQAVKTTSHQDELVPRNNCMICTACPFPPFSLSLFLSLYLPSTAPVQRTPFKQRLPTSIPTYHYLVQIVRFLFKIMVAMLLHSHIVMIYQVSKNTLSCLCNQSLLTSIEGHIVMIYKYHNIVMFVINQFLHSQVNFQRPRVRNTHVYMYIDTVINKFSRIEAGASLPTLERYICWRHKQRKFRTLDALESEGIVFSIHCKC